MDQIFEVKKKTYQVKLPDGGTIEIKVPSVFDIKTINEKLEAAKPSEAVGILLEFYKKLGMTDAALDHFDSKDFNDFFLFLMNGKKN